MGSWPRPRPWLARPPIRPRTAPLGVRDGAGGGGGGGEAHVALEPPGEKKPHRTAPELSRPRTGSTCAGACGAVSAETSIVHRQPRPTLRGAASPAPAEAERGKAGKRRRERGLEEPTDGGEKVGRAEDAEDASTSTAGPARAPRPLSVVGGPPEIKCLHLWGDEGG